MTRIAIAADLHADDYAGIPGRFEDILQTVAWVARTAKERGADVLVVAGDYTESRIPARAPRVVKIAAALAGGPERQIHIRGNHDVEWQGESIVTDLARTPGWTGFSFGPGFEIVDGVAIVAIPHLDRSWARTVDEPQMLDGQWIAPSRMTDAQLYRWLGDQYPLIAAAKYSEAMGAGCRAAILVGHQQLAGGRMTDKQASFFGDLDVVVDPRALASIGFSAVVFGHVHRGQTLVDDAGCPVLFAGSIERVDFAEQDEDKSFVLLDIEPEDAVGRPPRTRVSWQRIPTPARRFVTIDAGPDGEELGDLSQIDGSIVRVVAWPNDRDTGEIRRLLEAAGAYAITDVRRARVDDIAPARGMDESLSAEQALDIHFADDPDRDALVALGREILAEAAA